MSAWEAPYQLAMIAALLEALAVLAFAPRSLGTEPFAVAAVVGLRGAAMAALGLLVRVAAPRLAWPALLGWAGFTLAPELWARALEVATGPLVVSAVGGTLYGLGMHGLARLLPRGWPLALALPAVALILPAPWSPYEQLLGSGLPFWVVLAGLVAATAWWRDERLARPRA